jgi:hypothetical protein
VFFSAPGKAHASGLDGERSYFSEYGVEYGGYIFAPLDKQIVKIPIGKDKINGNAEFVMNFPEEDVPYFDEKHIFIKNGGNLYINFSSYMYHGGLFRITHGSDKPAFVVKADIDAGGIEMTDSSRHPETLKFLRFGEGDAGVTYGNLYGYLPHKNKAVKLKSYRSEMKINDFIGITKDDAVLTSQLVNSPESKMSHLEGVNRITINPDTGEVETKQLLNGKDMPKTYFIAPGPGMEKLYLFGADFSVFDVKKGSLKKVVEFQKIIKNWPDDAYPYLDEYRGQEAGEDFFIFVIDIKRPDRFYIIGNSKTVRIDAFNETYENVSKVKGDHLW